MLLPFIAPVAGGHVIVPEGIMYGDETKILLLRTGIQSCLCYATT